MFIQLYLHAQIHNLLYDVIHSQDIVTLVMFSIVKEQDRSFTMLTTVCPTQYELNHEIYYN